MFYLAIDQHRKQLTVNLRNEEGDVVERRQVSTQWAKVRKYFAALREKTAADGGFVAILEVCGFNDWLLKLLPEYGCRETVLVQPEKRRDHKTDHRDADALGEILWTNRRRLLAGKRVQNVRRVQPPSEEEAQNRQLTQLRKRTTDARTRTLNRIHHLLNKHNLRQECPTKGLQTNKARRWLAELALPKIDRLEMDQLLATWQMLNEQLAAQDEEIEKRQAEHPTARVIATIPGVSKYSSLALACRLSDGIERFDRGQSLANFWGLTPGSGNSGEHQQRLGSITKAGSTLARCILGHLVLHVLRKDPWMRAWYRRIKGRRGSSIARVAVMRRLATIIWSMVKHEEPYCPGGPERVDARRAAARALA